MQGITIQTGDRIRTWGGWYRHDAVLLDGVKIGTIQVRRKPRRPIDTITMSEFHNGCVIGANVEWLKRMAGK